MELTFAPRGILQIDDARIIHKNFSGRESKYNRKGDRNFSVVIPDEDMANALTEEGWNVKIRPPREEGESPFMFLGVKVGFNEYGPTVYLKSGEHVRRLDEETVDILDGIEIESVDLDIAPHDWNMPDGRTGRSAYLRSIHVVQRIDRFAARYEEE